MIQSLLPHLYTALLVIAGMVLRDLWCYYVAKVYCWRKRRQTQRAAQLQRKQDAVRIAAREADKRIQNVVSEVALAQYPFVIEASTSYSATITARRIYCDLRAGDRRRFFACEATREVN